MKARAIANERVILSEREFAQIVIWEVPAPVPGSSHGYKYRLAYVRDGECVMRYDNEAGKGDHRHTAEAENAYQFKSLEKLLEDFYSDLEDMRP
jgi:hypothetical protein